MQTARKTILEKLARVADPSIPKTYENETSVGDYVKLLKATACVPANSIGQVACPWPGTELHVDFPDRRGVKCPATDLEYVKPPDFDLEEVVRNDPHWSCCGNERFSSRGCAVKAHEWKRHFNPDPDRSSIPSILRKFGLPS